MGSKNFPAKLNFCQKTDESGEPTRKFKDFFRAFVVLTTLKTRQELRGEMLQNPELRARINWLKYGISNFLRTNVWQEIQVWRGIDTKLNLFPLLFISWPNGYFGTLILIELFGRVSSGSIKIKTRSTLRWNTRIFHPFLRTFPILIFLHSVPIISQNKMLGCYLNDVLQFSFFF